MDLCHLKNSELVPKIRPIVLRGNVENQDSGSRRKKSTSCFTDGQLSFEECWIKEETPEIQTSSCTSRWYCEWRFTLLCNINGAKFVSVTNDDRESSGRYWQTTWMRRTNKRRNKRSHPSQNWKTLQNDWNFPNLNVPTLGHLYIGKLIRKNLIEFLDICLRLPRHKMPKSWHNSEEPMNSLERNIGGHPFARFPWQRQFGKMGEKQQLGNVLSCIVSEVYSCLCTWATSKLLGKHYLEHVWNRLMKHVDLEKPTSFIGQVFFFTGMKWWHM